MHQSHNSWTKSKSKQILLCFFSSSLCIVRFSQSLNLTCLVCALKFVRFLYVQENRQRVREEKTHQKQADEMNWIKTDTKFTKYECCNSIKCVRMKLLNGFHISDLYGYEQQGHTVTQSIRKPKFTYSIWTFNNTNRYARNTKFTHSLKLIAYFWAICHRQIFAHLDTSSCMHTSIFWMSKDDLCEAENEKAIKSMFVIIFGIRYCLIITILFVCANLFFCFAMKRKHFILTLKFLGTHKKCRDALFDRYDQYMEMLNTKHRYHCQVMAIVSVKILHWLNRCLNNDGVNNGWYCGHCSIAHENFQWL